MDRLPVSLVVATGAMGQIGNNGALPWGRLQADMSHFARVTRRQALIMGRKTWESLPGPLEGRLNVVLTSDPAAVMASSKSWPVGSSVVAFDDLEAALGHAQAWGDAEGATRVCVIGGATLYTQAEPYADELIHTAVHANPPADTFYQTANLLHRWGQYNAEVMGFADNGLSMTMTRYWPRSHFDGKHVRLLSGKGVLQLGEEHYFPFEGIEGFQAPRARNTLVIHTASGAKKIRFRSNVQRDEAAKELTQVLDQLRG